MASLGILAAVAVVHTELLLALGVIALGAVWIRIAISLQTHYLALFRESLGEVTLRTHLDFPGLDLASLEALIAALSSPDDDEVLAAISNRIINGVKGINRVVYDISSKPPATIEWE